jgi:hypothetical protein
LPDAISPAERPAVAAAEVLIKERRVEPVGRGVSCMAFTSRVMIEDDGTKDGRCGLLYRMIVECTRILF